jgi:hypothetical protein
MSSDNPADISRALLAVGTAVYASSDFEDLDQVPASLKMIVDTLTRLGYATVAGSPGYSIDPQLHDLHASLRQVSRVAPIVVVYYTGYAAQERSTLYLITRESRYADLGKTATRAIDLLGDLTRQSDDDEASVDQRQVLIILDCIYPQSTAIELLSQASTFVGQNMWLIASTGSDKNIQQGEFAAAFVQAIERRAQITPSQQRSVDLESIVADINSTGRVGARLFQPPTGSVSVPLFFPNPSYEPSLESPSSDTGHPADQVVTEDLSEFSDSIRKVVASIGSAEVTASAFAEEIRKLHPEYAGGRFGSLKLNVNAGDQRPLSEWLSLMRAQYDLKTVAESRHKVIDGHLALAALAAVDAPLSDQIDEATLAALEEESEVKPHGPPAREHVRWLVDDPVGLDGDELGRRGVASALEDQLRAIVRDFSGRSFLVHIDGPWGAGKSTLLRFLHESVDRHIVPDRWLVVSYDSWRQSRVGPPWLTLLQAVRTVVRSAQPHIWDRGWFWLRERARLVNSWQWITLFLMVVAATTLAALLIGGDIHLTLSNWGDIGKLVGGLVPVVGAFWLIAKSTGRFVSLDSRRSARTFLETRADPMEDLAAHFHWLLCKARSPVLLLIDDLDRCPETFVVDLLDAVQKLMRDSMPDANSRSGERKPTLLVVVAADGRWVRNSYDNAYASLAHAVNEPGATVGTLFLEKLFQLTVPVPGLSDELKAEYLRDLLAERPARPVGREADPNLMRRLSEATHDQLLDVLADAPAIERVKASSLAIEKLVVRPDAQQSTRHALEPYAALLDPTPRAMKRFVMAYSMLRAVRTAEGSVVGIGPLALWTILQTRWPMLANYLQASPEAVRLFQVSADRIPGSTPVELVPLFTDPPNELRAVMNHRDGPMNAQTIRECSGQTLSH